MQIKIENNRVLVAQKSTKDLTGYQEASPTEAQIIFEANETDTLSMISGAYYEPKDNADWRAEKAEREKQRAISDIQMQIDVIDKKRVRALCEPQLKDSESGETWLDFYTGQVIVLRDKITEILKGE